MRRYSVPRIVFVNKLDRVGANPWRVIQQARDKLKLNAAAVQVRKVWDPGRCRHGTGTGQELNFISTQPVHQPVEWQ